MESVFGWRLELLRRSISENILLQIVTTKDVPWAEADANQLENAILNLAINARDASQAGGCIVVRTRSCDIVTAAPDLLPGAPVQLTVSGTG